MRDHYTCQYCNEASSAGEMTLDHVLPRSLGGASSRENLVAACRRGNDRKGDRLPEEANMKLRKRPKPFTLHTSRSLMRRLGGRRQEWRKRLFH